LPLDSAFLAKAYVAGNKEIQLSKLADQHTKNEKVKEFAQHMIQDHSKANMMIVELMKNQKVAVVAGAEKDLREVMDKLGKLQGAEFDREYARTMVSDHKEAVMLFENQAKNGKEADATKFARETLPTIRGHLKHAEGLVSSLGR